MKKLIAILLVLVLTLSLAACGGEEGPDVTGKYICVGSSYEGPDSYTEPAFESWIELERKGKGSYTDGIELTLKWSMEGDSFTGTVSFLGMEETMTGTLKDGILEVEYADSYLLFVKEGVKAPELGGKETEPSQTEPLPTETEPQPTETEPVDVEFVPQSIQLSEGRIDINFAHIFTDSNGSNVLRIYYDFTNTGEESLPAISAAYFSAEQDGVALSTAYVAFEEESPEYFNDVYHVRPGVSIRCVTEFYVDPLGGNIDLAICEFTSDEPYVVTLNPNTLPGAPYDVYQPDAIWEPTWTDPWPDGDVYRDVYYIYIDSAEIVEGYEGEEVLRVYYEFTNNSDEPISMWYAAIVMAYQDGVELDSCYPTEVLDTDAAYSLEVAPGETVLCSACYTLRSDRPVEIEIADYANGTFIGCCFILE